MITAIRNVYLLIPVYFSPGLDVRSAGSVENTICRRDLDRAMPGCESSCVTGIHDLESKPRNIAADIMPSSGS